MAPRCADTPPVGVQYGIRAVRVAQVGIGAFYFLGEQAFGFFGARPPRLHGQMLDNRIMVAAGVYALDVVAQTLKSINAFELTYNGHVVRQGGRF
jgi:hypothetical protein